MSAAGKYIGVFGLAVMLTILVVFFLKGCGKTELNPVAVTAAIGDSIRKVAADSVAKIDSKRLDSASTLIVTFYERAQAAEQKVSEMNGTIKTNSNLAIQLADSVRYWKSVGNALKASTACDSLASEVFVLTAGEDYWHAMADTAVLNLEKTKKEQDVRFAQQKADFVAMQNLFNQAQASNQTLQKALQPKGKWFAGGMIGAGPNNAGLGINISYQNKQDKIIEGGSIFNTTGNIFYYIGVKIKLTPPSLKSIL